MEADSTTFENNKTDVINEAFLPFNANPENFKLYKDLISNNGDKSLEGQIIERLQNFGLIPSYIKCPSEKPDCKVICKTARVVDRVQWVCEGCGKRQPIRTGSFFLRLPCSILQAMQVILAWCEDVDYEYAAEHFGVKPKVASHIYDKLDELAIRECIKHKLGGENSVVLSEIYPDCLNRLSPDTTDQPHVHRILMLSDTTHFPTYYRLHVLRDDCKKTSSLSEEQMLKSQIEEIVQTAVSPQSALVSGSSVPGLRNATPIQQLTPHCNLDMQHFLSSRIWRQGISLCGAARDFCGVGAAGAAGGAASCALSAQRYLHAACYRLRHQQHFYQHILELIATDLTS